MIAPPLADVVLELAAGGVEGVTNGDVDVFVRLVLVWLAIHDHDLARDREIDPHVEEPALVMMAVMLFHHHVAGGDVVAELLEPAGFFPNALVDGGRGSHFAEGDSKGNLHGDRS
jgi:hypothetical protein